MSDIETKKHIWFEGYTKELFCLFDLYCLAYFIAYLLTMISLLIYWYY